MKQLRDDFPLLKQEANHQALIYLDSAATSQKPRPVIEAVNHYYQHDNANVHRGLYALSQRATAAYEGARQVIKQFINAQHNHEIIFTRGATEAINLIASSFGGKNFKPGDEILISAMEHHSNIVPWQIVAEQTGAVLKIIPIHDNGILDMQAYEALLSEKTKLVSIIHISNVLGTINPIERMIDLAHAYSIPVLIDGAQATPHSPIDVQALDCDFYVFSSHKMYGPTGVGVLYGKETLLEKMPPYQSGGDMIRSVSFTKTDYNILPYKFEAGTPNIAGVIGLRAAIDYLNQIGMEYIISHEKDLTEYALQRLMNLSGVNIIGSTVTEDRAGVISFTMDQAHAHDIATILDTQGIAIRAGHHCAMPLMERLGLSATARISFGLYNQREDIDCFMQALAKVNTIFK